MQKLTFEIHINAPVQKVWDTMLGDATYRVWTAEFNPKGSWYEGKWETGSKILFLGPDQSTEAIGGMTSEIAECRKYEYVSIRHLGYVLNGVEVTDTPEIEAWAPGYENYTFVDLGDGTTKLEIAIDSIDGLGAMFSEMWPRALKVLKEICE